MEELIFACGIQDDTSVIHIPLPHFGRVLGSVDGFHFKVSTDGFIIFTIRMSDDILWDVLTPNLNATGWSAWPTYTTQEKQRPDWCKICKVVEEGDGAGCEVREIKKKIYKKKIKHQWLFSSQIWHWTTKYISKSWGCTNKVWVYSVSFIKSAIDASKYWSKMWDKSPLLL